MQTLGHLLNGLGGLACIIGGWLLFTARSVASEGRGFEVATMIEVFAKGLGIYCIGRGIAIIGNSLLTPTQPQPAMDARQPEKESGLNENGG